LQAFGDVAGITADGFTLEAIYWDGSSAVVNLSDTVITGASEYPNGFVVAWRKANTGLAS
jgi:hypothetical protein